MDWCLYWQRNIVECLCSALKRLFGDTIKSHKMPMINAELFCRLIAYNLGALLWDFFYRAGARGSGERPIKFNNRASF